ncbi:MAG: pilus assembly protein PilP [Gammaproteobacteria bacterium]|nr:MAG: pilus assembly protein PilP [Gammaproteobacteria bacterium]
MAPARHPRHPRPVAAARAAAAALLAAAALALGGCGGDGMADLKAYVQQVKARPGGRVEPIPEVRPFETFVYRAEGRRSPFEPWRRATVSIAQLGGGGGGPRPDPNRRKEPLEAFPLDKLKMVGTLAQGRQRWALVRAPDGLVYRVGVGNHLGQHHGRITRVSEDRIELVELIPDGVGGWRQRKAQLELAE